MPSRKVSRVLKRFATAARERILCDFRADSCVASTLVAIRVLDAFGIKALPVPCHALIFNKQFVDAVTHGERYPDATKQPDEFKKWCDDRNAWSVGIGVIDKNGVQPGKWGGHLVAVLPKERILVDASLNQGSRPQYGIELPGVFIGRLGDDSFQNGEPLEYTVNGSKVIYRRIANSAFLAAPDWTDHSRTDTVVQDIIDAIRKG